MALTEYVRKEYADVTMAGRARGATRDLVTNVARITASVRMAPVSALKDGMAGTAHFVSTYIHAAVQTLNVLQHHNLYLPLYSDKNVLIELKSILKVTRGG